MSLVVGVYLTERLMAMTAKQNNELPMMMLGIFTWRDKLLACWKVIRGDVPVISYFIPLKEFYKGCDNETVQNDKTS